MKKYNVIVFGGGFAGVAIAQSVKTGLGVRDINVKEMIQTLRNQGAFLGNND